jgi:2-methylcitrate dehydratase
VPLPELGESKRAILESYTKEHSAEYQAQALIDLAIRMRKSIADLSQIESIVIHTSQHTHRVIGSGANDPQKLDPRASRETLDHSIMYIFAVALEDGCWHHTDSYTPERASRPSTGRLWRSISTREDPEWTKRYHSEVPDTKAFGGRVEILFRDQSRIEDEMAVANAHPLGAKPFGREDYLRKFVKLTEGILFKQEAERYLEVVQRLPHLSGEEIQNLSLSLPDGTLVAGKQGIFDCLKL